MLEIKVRKVGNSLVGGSSQRSIVASECAGGDKVFRIPPL